MKKSSILLAMLMTANVWAISLGTETIDNKTYYQIGSCEDLKEFASYVNERKTTDYVDHATSGLDKTFYQDRLSANAVLTNDIDCSGEAYTPIAGKFISNSSPKDSIYNMYRGTFDGQGHVISNLTSRQSGEVRANLGLIGYLDSAGVVKNVIIQNPDLVSDAGTSNNDFVGGIAGLSYGTISKCTVVGNASIISSHRNAGGIVGRGFPPAVIEDCLSSVKVEVTGTSNQYAGGIIGRAMETDGNTVTIRNTVYIGSSVSCSNPKDGSNCHAHEAIGGDNATIENSCYYDENAVISAKGYTPASSDGNEKCVASPNLNDESTVCILNGGSWNDSQCNGGDGPWLINGTLTNQENFSTDPDGNLYFAISFNANGGEFAENAKTKKMVKEDESIDASDIGEPTRTGYKFKGWAATNDATTPLTSLGSATTTTTFYAVWSVITYHITYMDGADVIASSLLGENSPTEFMIDSSDITLVDAKMKILNGGSEGYIFEGWYSESELQNKVTIIPTGSHADVALYAKYTRAYKIAYYLDGSQKFVWYLPDSNIVNPQPTEWDSYNEEDGFSGWVKWYYNDDDELVDLSEDIPTKMPNHDLVVEGFSTYGTSVTFNANGGNFGNVDYTEYTTLVKRYTNITADGVPQINRENYVFKGWAFDANASEPASLGKTTYEMEADGLTLYAVWDALSYDIAYENLNGATNDNPAKYTVEDEVTLVAPGERMGYSFAGWYGNAEFTGGAVTVIAKGTTGEKTFYAKWKKNITVTIKGHSSSSPYNGADQTVEGYDVSVPEGSGYDVLNVAFSSSSGAASATGKVAGEYTMGLTAADFTNLDGDNFVVTFDVTDGKLTITKATENEVGVTLANWTYGSANVPDPVVTGLGAETATFLYAEVGDTSSADSWKSSVPTDIGNYYVKATIPETGNYVGGSAVATFEIAAKSAENLVVTVTPSSGDYNGFSQFPSIVVKDGGTVLEEGVDYTVSITKGDVSTEEMKNAGTYTITVTGKGVYDGSVQGTYTIAQSTEAVYVGLDGWTYGDETLPAPVMTPSYVDEGSVVVEYAKKAGDVDTSNAANWSTTLPKNAGDYYVRATVSETANYAGGSATSEFTIEQREVVIAWSETNPTYTGEALSPTATVTNLVGSDVCNVTVSGSATNVGEGTVTARASALDNPNYKLPATAPSTEFSVAPKSASGFEVTVTPSDFTYTGSAVNPTIVVKDGDKTLSVGTDYTVSGAENISEVGEHVVTITGAGNYNESTTVKFTVSPVVTVTLASDESLVCEGDKGAACNEAQDNIDHVYGVATNELPDASKSGWEFQGWYDSVTGDEVTSIAADRTAELNLVPKFAKDSTFEYEVDGEKKTVTVEVVYGETVEQIITKIVAALDDAVPTKEQTATTDYIYAGTWEVVDGKIVPKFTETAREYTVTLNVPDGATVSPSMTKYAAGTATNLPSANLDGWTFVGWVDGSGNSVTQIAVDATGDKAYTAVFTKDITVVYGEGAGDKLAVEIKLDDSEAEIIAKIEDALEAAGVTPTKSPDADSTYEFNGKWDVDGNTFTAEFEGTVKTETVIVKYGEGAGDKLAVEIKLDDSEAEIIAKIEDALEAAGVTPTKSPDADSTYEFNGKWDVDGNTFTAEFEGTVKTETVIVKYGDGAEDLIEVIVPKAANDSVRTAVVMDSLQSKGITPTKSPDADSTYEFNGKWDVDGNTFSAEFEGSPKYIEVVVGDDTVKVVIPDTTSGTGSADSIIVKVKVVVDSDTIMVPVIDGDILDSAAKKVLDSIPTKDDSADSTYEFAGWEPIKDSTGKPVVDENGNEIYEPVFKREVKKDSILVAAGDGRTVEVLIYVTDGNAEIQKKIIDTFNDSGIPLPQKDNENDTLYKLNEFVLNVENGIYEPIFKQVIFYPVAFVMPKDGMLLSEFDGYVYGERTVLPEACIKSDSDWEFKGWYTERDGLGTRVRMMLETDRGKKTFYPLFQKTIYYSINGINGEIEVIYTDNAEKNIVRALDRVVPEDYRKNSVNYTFDKWVLENGTYVAKFVEGQGIHSNVLANVHIEVVGHVLEVTGVVSGSKVLVYDARGRLVQSAITGAGSLHMNVQNPGRYIVRVDNWTMPVNVH